MRLIDADEMMKRLQAWDTDDKMDNALYRFALERVIEAPTVKAIPIHWLDFYCTDCTIDLVDNDAEAIKKMVNDWREEHGKD